MDHVAESNRAELFLRQYTENQHRLAAFVHALVPDWQDAEELLQDTLMILWRKFDGFDLSSEFFPWAAQVAQFEVLNYWRRRKREQPCLDAQVIEAMASTAVEASTDLELQREALAHCLQQLPPRDRHMIKLRYREGGSVRAVADAIDRSTSLVHKSLQRIRCRLLRCVRAKLDQASHV